MGVGIALGVSAAVSLAAAGVSAYGQMQSADAQMKAAGAQAGIDQSNALITREQNRIQALAERRAAEISGYQADLSILQSKVSAQNSKNQALFETSQLLFSANQADQNAVILGVRSEVQARNANTLFRYARLTRDIGANKVGRIETQSRERVRRIREQSGRVQSMMRSRVGASGVVMEGSPLEALADVAGTMELSAQDAVFEAEVARRDTMFQTEMEAGDLEERGGNARFESAVTRVNAAQSRESAQNSRRSTRFVAMGRDLSLAGFALEGEAGGLAKQSAGYRGAMADYAYRSADAGFAMDMQTSNLNRFASESTARATQIASYGTILSGVSDAAGTVASAGGSFGKPDGSTGTGA
jgi:hypothetical protein